MFAFSFIFSSRMEEEFHERQIKYTRAFDEVQMNNSHRYYKHIEVTLKLSAD
jgi:hypothetical protein